MKTKLGIHKASHNWV